MRPLKPALLCLCAALCGPSGVAAQMSPGQTVGTTADAIRSALTAAGYDVISIEAKSDGKHEVDAVFDGHALEIDVSRDGQITEIELDD
ncbi:MAG: PepSY domain-containing protein [Pseudomonadota bacterium]